MPGILRWAVEGRLKWQKEGLKEPEVIRKATEGYREDMDILGPYISERCVVHPSAKIEAKELYKDYKTGAMKMMRLNSKIVLFIDKLKFEGLRRKTERKIKSSLWYRAKQISEPLEFSERVNEGVNESNANSDSKRLLL